MPAPLAERSSGAGAPMNILLLQGPVGPFFTNLARELRGYGHRVFKVNFNGGDLFFYRGEDVFNFRGSLSDWPGYLRQLLQQQRIDRIYVFGDQRLYHITALRIARQLQIETFVFEEGYIRPDYITLEENGVNANSSLSRNPAFYLAQGRSTEALEPPQKAESVFSNAAWYSIAYWICGGLLRPFYPAYRHHRGFNFAYEAFIWVRSGIRKIRARKHDERVLAQLVADHSGKYFLVPLQVANDSQIHAHSDFKDSRQFIAKVIESFARHAPKDTLLVLKHHPLDRGYTEYASLIRHIGERLGVAERLRYVHDCHLPTLLDHARGVVTINSTVGLSALLHHAPLKTLGRANYDLPGLTFQGPLSAFWNKPQAARQELFEAFREYLLSHNQINGNFYSRLENSRNASGVIWPEWFRRRHLQGLPDDQQPPIMNPATASGA